jgi:hypothetical protein
MSARTALGVLLTVGVMLPAAASAQHQHGHPQHASPYRDQHGAALRGLSAQEIGDLEAGRGMGLARAAELNGYPGPRHVLDAVRDGALQISAEQRQAVQRVFEGMERDARRLGTRVIAEEQALETAFNRGGITESELTERVRRVAAAHAELREVHLRAHVATRALLSEDQVKRYNELRGYAATQRR